MFEKNGLFAFLTFSCSCNYSVLYYIQQKEIKIKMNYLCFHSGQKPFMCDQCNYSSANSSNLKVHKRTHTGEKSYTCNKCSFSSKDSTNLQKHVAKKHREQPKVWKTNELFSLYDTIMQVFFLFLFKKKWILFIYFALPRKRLFGLRA